MSVIDSADPDLASIRSLDSQQSPSWSRNRETAQISRFCSFCRHDSNKTREVGLKSTRSCSNTLKLRSKLTWKLELKWRKLTSWRSTIMILKEPSTTYGDAKLQQNKSKRWFSHSWTSRWPISAPPHQTFLHGIWWTGYFRSKNDRNEFMRSGDEKLNTILMICDECRLFSQKQQLQKKKKHWTKW